MIKKYFLLCIYYFSFLYKKMNWNPPASSVEKERLHCSEFISGLIFSLSVSFTLTSSTVCHATVERCGERKEPILCWRARCARRSQCCESTTCWLTCAVPTVNINRNIDINVECCKRSIVMIVLTIWGYRSNSWNEYFHLMEIHPEWEIGDRAVGWTRAGKERSGLVGWKEEGKRKWVKTSSDRISTGEEKK